VLKVYLQRPGIIRDKLLGRVEDNGRVYRSRPGPDDEIGHVHLDSGKVYAQRLGNDDYVGRVDLENGKVWRGVTAGPDDYLGRVHDDGHMDYHLAGRADEYIGRMTGQPSLALAGAAFLLLVWPAFEQQKLEDEDVDST
jgi:hypothetical protein